MPTLTPYPELDLSEFDTCEHEWVRSPGDYRHTDGRRATVYDCRLCPELLIPAPSEKIVSEKVDTLPWVW